MMKTRKYYDKDYKDPSRWWRILEKELVEVYEEGLPFELLCGVASLQLLSDSVGIKEKFGFKMLNDITLSNTIVSHMPSLDSTYYTGEKLSYYPATSGTVIVMRGPEMIMRYEYDKGSKGLK